MARLVLDTPAPKAPASTFGQKIAPAPLPAPSGVQQAGTSYDALNKNRFVGIPQAPVAAQAAQAATPAALIAGGSGGGGGGAGGAIGAGALTPADLNDYITKNYLYTSTKDAGDRSLQDFDAATLQGQQGTEAQQAQKQGVLTQNLDDLGQQNAEDLAGRGLLNSGINFQNQDKINQQGAQGQNSIAQMLTDFINQRQTGREAQVSANQAALNQQIAALTGQFNTQNNTQFNPAL